MPPVKYPGVHPDFLLKLVFEIAVAQQTRTRDQTFELSQTPTAHRCPWSNFGSIMPNHLNMFKSIFLLALLVSCSQQSPELVYKISSRLNKKQLSYEPKTICSYLDICTKFYSNRPINSSNINIFERVQLNMKGKPKLHVPCNQQLNISLNVNTKAKKLPKINKIVHISVRDNRKIGFTKKPKTFPFFNIFRIGVELNFALNLLFRFRSPRIGGQIMNFARQAQNLAAK